MYFNCWPKIVLFGDSLTQFSYNEDSNWAGYLASHFQRKADVLNRGFSGYTSETIKYILPKFLNDDFAKDVACITIFLGANDSWAPTKSRFDVSVPVDNYEKNLYEIIDYLNKIGIDNEKIILMTPPIIILEDWIAYCKAFKQYLIIKTNDHVKKYAEKVLRIGGSLNIKVVDIYSLTWSHLDQKKLFSDGLHFSDLGSKLVFNSLKETIDTKVENFRKTNKENFPDYSEINYKDVKKSFDC